MRTGRTAGRSDPADDLPNADNLAHLHGDFGQMAIARCEPVAVTDCNHVSIAAFAAGNSHLAGRGCSHRLTDFATQVDAGMDCRAAQKRVHAHAERRTHVRFPDHRFTYWHRDQHLPVTVDLCSRYIDSIELTFKCTGARLRRSDRDKGSANCSVGRPLAGANSKISQYAMHPACTCIDTFLEIRERCGLLLLD